MTSNQKIGNNCSNFGKFPKILKTNAGFHLTRLVIDISTFSISGLRHWLQPVKMNVNFMRMTSLTSSSVTLLKLW